ncbi:MAG: 30S ribosomal protein S6 [Elusimicrobia bacterium RIFCSPLOWO2_01_FULL_64_13]|nr:MAG: 30S ribosomal protein S6 [Elusimicrobia bacterium RIFCSPHIGHO2_01_FULL_64_10]OGR97907.1 MAG: 30S ribosomal protein S6 [Elusimicrobia bacterium RIFCSPLOWO2_01_FULL_64_13]
MNQTYESIFICPGEMPQDKIEAALEKTKAVISRSNGHIVTAELWGRRKLAYPIKRNREGHYAYLLFSSSPGVPAQLDRHYRVTDTILRGLTVKVDPRQLDKVQASLKAQAAAAAGPSLPAAAEPAPPPPPPA